MKEHNYDFRELHRKIQSQCSAYVDSFYVKGVVEMCVWRQVWRQTEWIRRPVVQESKPDKFSEWVRQPAPRFHVATE